jgi:hypothetical protein
MTQFYRFKTACFPDDSDQYEDLGIPTKVDKLEYKDLPIRLSSIIYYYPLRALNLDEQLEEVDFLSEDEIWDYAEYVTIILVDGTQLTVKINIKDFQDLIEG